MNNEINQGQWRELKGEIRKTWGNLTEDELEKASGNIDQIAGRIQQRYGESMEQAKSKIDSMLENISERI